MYHILCIYYVLLEQNDDRGGSTIFLLGAPQGRHIEDMGSHMALYGLLKHNMLDIGRYRDTLIVCMNESKVAIGES